MKRIILNPFVLYVIAFSLAFLLYIIHWSDLFPHLDTSLFVFLLITAIISGLFGYGFFKFRPNILSKLSLSDTFYTKSLKWIFIGYCLEFLYARRIPLLSLSTLDDSFEHFGGIPTLHVILVTYNVFFDVVYFQKLLQGFNGEKNIFYFILISLLPPLLMVNRGMLFTIFISCLLMYLTVSKGSLKSLAVKSAVVISILLIVFSLLGRLRINDSGDNRAFAAFAQPSEQFDKLGLDPLILWPYMYMASPMANLDNCIEIAEPEYNLKKFLLTCICPDFISKRIASENDLTTDNYLISPVFNVSTMYYRAYITMGYYGMGLLFLYQCLIIWFFLYTSTPKNNQYYTVSFCLISSTIILGTFTNMWIFSAVSFPILWSPILKKISKWKFPRKSL